MNLDQKKYLREQRKRAQRRAAPSAKRRGDVSSRTIGRAIASKPIAASDGTRSKGGTRMLESQVEAKCRRYALERGWRVYKLSPVGNRGAFDRIYVGPGVVLFVEHKQAKGVKRGHQVLEQASLRRRGHVAEFCYSFAAFRELLDNPVSSASADPEE